ncbi:hypothetical protein ACSCB1_05655 [Streptomyces europaeiscabiei]|uniref:Secreted protein n=1 Tax=Streptomyces europaeiscabiei TaxID=146819 RepID=A0ABU4NWM1_9ACTN|nr:hypothetical protein [Streptomyces europaeiscabiei]MDX2527324.1 hypothetical protein [Streptomyces europaeiscabiei]MDX2759478.1 hypothetical protein [Streptomyces europaeiscabiei]MDX3549037.1 hypothetical protein [Streptomyces europaeiscabiei]MDX3558255.1 hypothetical protein [Streptomyces europaeiscabiei]MDX3706264.1 hypothetical protein [Streptomyces europaeiscabiei]
MNSTRTRRGTAAALTVLLATALGAAGAGASNADSAAPKTRQIASSVLGSDYKITLTALRSTEDEYAASVRLQVFTRSGGAWKESDRVTVGDMDGWFWYPLTGKGAVCQLSTAGTEPAPLTVSLLLTPSLGCSDPAHFVVKQGRVYAG